MGIAAIVLNEIRLSQPNQNPKSKPEIRTQNQKTEIRKQKTKIGKPKSENRNQKTEIGKLNSENQNRKTEIGKPKSEKPKLEPKSLV